MVLVGYVDRVEGNEARELNGSVADYIRKFDVAHYLTGHRNHVSSLEDPYPGSHLLSLQVLASDRA